MQNSESKAANKTLIAAVIFLFLILLGLNSYLILLNKIHISIPSQDTGKLDFFEFSTMLANNSADDIALIAGVRDLRPLLANFNALTQKSGNKLQFTNPYKENYYGEFTEPIILNSGFRLLLNFSTQNTDSEIVFYGKENLQENEWWENIHQLRIGYNNEEEGYYLSLLNGKKEGSCWYQILENTKPGQTLILEFANNTGQAFWVKDTFGKILVQLDLTAERDLQMAQGLFPYSTFKIGLNLPPKDGKLILNKLFSYGLE